MPPMRNAATLAEMKDKAPGMHKIVLEVLRTLSECPTFTQGIGLEASLERMEQRYDTGELLLFFDTTFVRFVVMMWNESKQHYCPASLAGRPFIFEFEFDSERAWLLNFENFDQNPEDD